MTFRTNVKSESELRRALDVIQRELDSLRGASGFTSVACSDSVKDHIGSLVTATQASNVLQLRAGSSKVTVTGDPRENAAVIDVVAANVGPEHNLVSHSDVSGETGTGDVVRKDSPEFTTKITTPEVSSVAGNLLLTVAGTGPSHFCQVAFNKATDGWLTLSNAGAGAAGVGIPGQFKSTLSIGTKPIDVTSTTACTNLNADMLDGQHASDFGVIVSATEPVSPVLGTLWLDTS